ncbi:MAG TPA: YgaP-like transmembrane domain [Chthoniobacter sp.]
MRFTPLQDVPGRHLRRLRMNVDNQERVGSLFIGGVFIAAALLRSRVSRWLLLGLGSELLFRGATGYCPVFDALGLDTRDGRGRDGVPGNQGLRIEHTVEIQCPAPELYLFWRTVEQLPRILRHVESVEPTDEWHSHWVARGPVGPPLEWDAEIINERENELIAWQSVHGASLKNAGSVRFEPITDLLTRVKVCLELQPVGGTAALAVGRLFGTDPQRELEYDLERFKDFAERELSPSSHSMN